MDQARGNVHAVARAKLEFFSHIGPWGLLNPQFQPAGSQVERFCLELVKMKRAAFALANFQDFAAVERVVCDPDLAPPAFGEDVYWLTNF
jgi:hypothetical protein